MSEGRAPVPYPPNRPCPCGQTIVDGTVPEGGCPTCDSASIPGLKAARVAACRR